MVYQCKNCHFLIAADIFNSITLVLWGQIAGNVCIHISEINSRIGFTLFYVQMRVKGLCASLGSGGEPRVMPIVPHVHIYYLLIIISISFWNTRARGSLEL